MRWVVTHATAGWPEPSWRRSPWCAVAAREQSNRRPRIGHGEPGALPVSAWRYAASTRPTYLGMCYVADVSEMHAHTHSPSPGMCTCPEAVRPIRDKGSGHIQLQRSYTFSRRQLTSRNPPRARTDSRELRGECTSVHVLIVGASRVARVGDPAVQTAHAVRPPEIRVNPRRLREIRRVFDFSKAVHRRCFSGGLAPAARRLSRLNA